MVVASGVLGLRTGLGVVTGVQGTWALRTGWGSCCNDEGSLHLLPKMVLLTGSLKWTAFVVFLKLLWGRV